MTLLKILLKDTRHLGICPANWTYFNTHTNTTFLLVPQQTPRKPFTCEHPTDLLPDERHDADARQHMLARQPLPRDPVSERVRRVGARFAQMAHEERYVGAELLLRLGLEVSHQPAIPGAVSEKRTRVSALALVLPLRGERHGAGSEQNIGVKKLSRRCFFTLY